MSRIDATVFTTFYGPKPVAAMPFSAFPRAQAETLASPSARVQAPRPPVRICTILRRLIPLLAAGWLAACSGQFKTEYPPVVTAPPSDLRADQARLYFYRPSDSLFPAIRPAVIINGRKAGTSVVGEAFYRDAQPGRYVIFLTSDDDERLTVTLAPGEIHYIRTSISMTWLGPHLAPESVTSDQGERELQSLILVRPRLED